MQLMQQKRKVYCEKQFDRIPITRTNITIQKKHKEKQFDFSRICQIDQLLNKNEQIYKNLKRKLQDISQAERNITNNINVIRPISYGTIEKSSDAQHNHYEKFLNDSDSYRANNFENFASSSIQTEKVLNQSLRRRIQNDSNNVFVASEQPRIRPIIEQDYELKQSSIHQFIQRQPSQQHSNFKRTNTSKNRIYLEEPVNRKSDSQEESLTYDYFINMTKTTHNNQSQKNLPSSSSLFLEKENAYTVNRSYEPMIDSMVRMNFSELSKRRVDIEKIYQQLKKEQQQIETSYQEYRKSFSSMHEMSTKKEQSIMKSMPLKSSPPKKGFERKLSPSIHASKMSSISKNESIPFIKQTKSSFDHTAKTNEKQISQTSQILEKQDYSPEKISIVKYCTQEFQAEQIPSKPQRMTARSHVFVPFNKLYKSPIIQMKNKNTLILARQSKQLSQKTSQHKIIDGKKYRFQQTIETDEQELIKSVLKHEHNIIAIVGGHQTLKKKLHMGIIAHSVDRILKIINSRQQNCLSLSLSYQEYNEKENDSKVKIYNCFDINESVSTKMIALQVEKTIEQIYQAIKKPPSLMQSTLMNKSTTQLNKDRSKVVKFTKLSLLSGKDYVWACHILSTNQVSFEFLQNIQVKDIVWSVNPLIKNYDEVAKTLSEANRYIEARIDS